MTLEGWTAIMYAAMATFSNFSFLYFAAAVLIGSFFLINLTLAIIKTKFTEAEKQEIKET
jgi:hypothetical protein